MTLQTKQRLAHSGPNKSEAEFDFAYQTVVNGLLRETGDDAWKRHAIQKPDGSAADRASPDATRLLAAFPEDFSTADLCDVVRIPLESQGREILIGVLYWSLTGRHQFRLPAVERDLSEGQATPIDLERFLRSTLQEIASRLKTPRAPEPEQMLEKIFQSRANIARFIRERAADIERITGADPLSFIEAEQALLIGHQTHPTAKSREGFSESEMAAYSPELRGRFPLHFFRVHPKIAHQSSAVPDESADAIVKRMLREDPAVPAVIKDHCEEPWVILPVHPWQARYVQSLDSVKRLLADGLIQDLGQAGSEWTPTTSVRTVYRENFEYMFKFSLNIKITNSVRVNLTRELDRSVEMMRLMQSDYGREIQADVPDFVFIQDPAYLSVKWADQVIEPLSCTFREAAFAHDADDPARVRDITAIASLVQDHPLGHSHRNRLYNIIAAIAEREKRAIGETALEWFDRYLDVSIYNLFKLYFRRGLCFEAHGQNSLLELEDGYPVRYLYRDSQGYFHRQAAHKDFCEVIPGLGEVTESIFPEDLANERLVYYLIINQVFSMINALGTQGLADEAALMRKFAALLDRVKREPARYPLDMIDHLQSNERLPCKSNLLTQYFNMDELVGDIATQSVYVDVENVIKKFAEELHAVGR
ncbi:MAG: IucA/IucC family siderophore biosynthesis protein [bacterium]|nr:IucA/IucC family siderophore biosynthesis protein [bacterium]